jgi:hypothetical protein
MWMRIVVVGKLPCSYNIFFVLFITIFVISTCRQPGCDAAIREETFDPIPCGAGLKLKAECMMGHKTSFNTCDFFNNSRTSEIDVKISALQLAIGLSMTQG